ncbi:MAG TPA: hypothetical protein VK137_08160, partial [Planctomycetaceae bacterium]|nr:hypothetical protein [Planctomycetaceae bacterium]
MQKFIDKHQQDILGVLSGFDRIRFRGTIRMLAYVNGLFGWLCDRKVLLKNFTDFAQGMTATIKESVHSVAKAAGRGVQYLASSALSKEDLVQELLRREGISDGLVCVLSCVEPCQSFDLHRNSETTPLDLV